MQDDLARNHLNIASRIEIHPKERSNTENHKIHNCRHWLRVILLDRGRRSCSIFHPVSSNVGPFAVSGVSVARVIRLVWRYRAVEREIECSL